MASRTPFTSSTRRRSMRRTGKKNSQKGLGSMFGLQIFEKLCVTRKEPPPDLNLHDNIMNCVEALELMKDNHIGLPVHIWDCVTELSKSLEFCASLVRRDAKKMYNVVLDQLHQLKVEYHSPLKLYFNNTCKYWEHYRVNVCEIRGVLTCCCAIPRLPIKTFGRPWTPLEVTARSKTWYFVPNEKALENYLLNQEKEMRRKKLDLEKVLIDDTNQELLGSSSYKYPQQLQQQPFSIIQKIRPSMDRRPVKRSGPDYHNQLGSSLLEVGSPIRGSDPAQWIKERRRSHSHTFRGTSIESPLGISIPLAARRRASSFDRENDVLL